MKFNFSSKSLQKGKMIQNWYIQFWVLEPHKNIPKLVSKYDDAQNTLQSWTILLLD